MPPVILAIIATVVAALPVVIAGTLVVGPFVLPLWLKTLKRMDRERLLAATGGVYKIVAEVARRTPGTLDDDVAKIVKMVEEEIGKSLKGEGLRTVVNAALSMHADPLKPNLSPGPLSGSPVSFRA